MVDKTLLLQVTVIIIDKAVQRTRHVAYRITYIVDKLQT